jgi:hypothetical protein
MKFLCWQYWCVVLEKVLLLVEGTGCATEPLCPPTSASRLMPCGTKPRIVSVWEDFLILAEDGTRVGVCGGDEVGRGCEREDRADAVVRRLFDPYTPPP